MTKPKSEPKVFISGRIPRVAYEMLAQEFDVSMHDDTIPLPKASIIEGLKGRDALLSLLSDPIDEEVIGSNPDLKIIANYGAGFNNIDVAAASSRKIPVTNTPVVSTNATADFTMGLLITQAGPGSASRMRLYTGRSTAAWRRLSGGRTSSVCM